LIFSRVGDPPVGPQITYEVYESAAGAEKRIEKSGYDFNQHPYFVNDRVLVYINDPNPGAAPSPLAERIRAECDCGEVHEAGKPLPPPEN
jgi:hypothetical protein